MKMLLLLFAMGISQRIIAQQFVHPGIPFTTSDLNLLKTNIKTEPWLSAYNSLASDSKSQLSYAMQGPFATVGRAVDINRGPWMNDMTAVHNLALMWIFTGDTAYAKKATGILNAWALTNTQWTGDEIFLDLGDYADIFITGADILKSTYPGWTAENTANVNNYFANVLWPKLDVPNPVRGLNQGALELKAAVGIAAFLDDTTKWRQAIASYRGDAGGGLANSLSNGEVGDAGRDEGHWAGEAEALAWSAEVAWKQGIDVFSELDNRLLAISELYAKFHTDTTGLKFIPFGGPYSSYNGWGSNGTAKRLIRTYNIIEGAYAIRKSIPVPYTVQMRNVVGENTSTFLYRKSADPSSATALPPIIHPAAQSVTNLTNTDIGNTGLAGSASYNNDSWTVKGAGADIPVPPLTAKDAFNFAFQKVTGDAVIITRVTALENTDAGAKAGIMFRESLTNDSRYVGLFLRANGGAVVTWRGATAWNKTATSWNNPPGGYQDHYLPAVPYWLKLEKSGSRITAFHSFDGISWTCISSVEIAMANSLYVGLCVTSHNTSVLNTSVFTGVAITNPSPAGSPVITSATADTSTIGSAFHYTVTASATPTSFSATGLPAGLTIDSANGVITGTPTVTGTFPVTLNATNGSGTGAAILMLTVLSNVAPAAPGSLSAIKESNTSIQLSWTGSANATSYTVKRSMTAGGPYTTIMSGVTGTSYVDASAFPGPNYYIVTALAGALESIVSNEVSLLLPPSVPSIPAVINLNGQVSLSWPAAIGAVTYNIKRGTASGGPYTTIASGVTDTLYTDLGLSNGTYYYYVISAEGGVLESANSIEALAIPGSSSGSWSSTAATGNWNEDTNWVSGIAPVSPAIVTFNSSTTDTLNNNIAGLEIPRMQFNAGADAFTIRGNTITLGNDITNNSVNAQVINLPVTLNRVSAINANAGDITLGGIINGSGSITKSGPASAILTGANTWTGGTTINGGGAGGWAPSYTLTIGGIGTGAIGAPISGPVGTGALVMNGGALMNVGSAVIYNDVVVKDSVKSYLYSQPGGLTFAGRLLGGGTIEHDGNSTNGLQLNGDNSQFTGTFISINRSSNHRIRFNTAASGSAKANWVFNNGFTDGQGFTFTDTIHFGSMSGSGQLRRDNGTPVISIGALNTNTTFSGVITGALTIVKEGTGIFRFTGNNNYSGTTTVTAGTLLLDSVGQITSVTTVKGGTIGGIGTCNAALNIGTGSGTGAMLAPGSQGIGTFTTTGLLTMQPDAAYNVELNTSQGKGDKVSANGLNLNNPRLSFTVIGADSLPLGTSFTIIDNTGSAAVTGTFNGLPELAPVSIGSFNFRITYKGGTGNDILLLDDRTTPSMITSADTATVLIGKSFSYTITAIKSPVSFHATGLPAGLSIDTSTGVISGIATVSGTFPVTLSATNAIGTGTATLKLKVLSNIVAGLIVAAGDRKNIIEWEVIQNLSYHVKRSLTPDGVYTVIANVNTTKYTDTTVTNGNAYYYVVASADSVTENPNSDTVVAIPNIGQYGYWKYDELSGTRGVDAWGANHATLATTATRSTGYAGQALKLNGTATAYASLPTDLVSTLNDFTISAWVSMDALSNWIRIFDFGTGTSKYLFLTVQGGTASGKSIIRYAIKNGGAEQAVTYNYTLPLNTWTHFAVTQSGNTCSLYINGVLVASNTNVNIKPATLGSTNQNYIGKSQYSADPMFKGAIDEFKIYSRALNAAEIAEALKVDQVITFAPINSRKTGDTDFNVVATASSGLPVTFINSNEQVATVTNGVVHLLKAGSTIITATQAGDVTHKPATYPQTLNVLPLYLKVMHSDGDIGQTANNILRPYLKIVNEDTVPVTYKELTARYWFTAENFAGINTWIDYAALGNHIKMNYVALDAPRTGAFGYVEYSFDTTAGTISAGSNSGIIQSRIANKDWSILAETDDYSYAVNQTYTANSHITLYRNGQLIWGEEPVNAAQVMSLKAYTQSISSAQNTISTYLKINNEGNMPVAYEDVSVRYWFTAEDTTALNYWIDYAKLSNYNITGRFERLNPTADGADTYFELKVKPAAGILYPLSNTGNIQYRIAKVNWSNFVQTNDYSYLPLSSFGENSHVTVYYKGQLIYGAEPVANGAATRTAVKSGWQADVLKAVIKMYPNPVADVLIVQISKVADNAIVYVFNNNGAIVHTQRLTNVINTVETRGWMQGVYYVKIKNGDTVTTEKVIKQ
ncbi:Por secretion system C-terminal sorting domain-containing protein [Chitinophaga sp. CF118]|nr:Por secretion system C-terminal sorting domain-containing protein [Chitinophaga sp. CF118]